MNITQSKNALAQCRSRTRLFETLASECELMNFDYDMSLSMRKNAARARISSKFAVAEVINFAEKIEGDL